MIIEIETVEKKRGHLISRPDFLNKPNNDFLFQGGEFQAFWDGEQWHTDVYDLVAYVDKLTKEEAEKQGAIPELMVRNSTSIMHNFVKFAKVQQDSNVQFDTKIAFKSEVPLKTDYQSKKLPYDPEEGSVENWDKLLSLYSEDDAKRIKWMIGCVLCNDTLNVQKFLYLYGKAGSGKGSVLKIIKQLIHTSWAPIKLSRLTSNSEFASAGIQPLPLLIDDDADTRFMDTTDILLTLTAHEPVTVNNKYQKMKVVNFPGLVFIASNERYRVRNVDAGINRRALVARTLGNKIPKAKFNKIMKGSEKEIPAIAYDCMQVYKKCG